MGLVGLLAGRSQWHLQGCMPVFSVLKNWLGVCCLQWLAAILSEAKDIAQGPAGLLPAGWWQLKGCMPVFSLLVLSEVRRRPSGPVCGLLKDVGDAHHFCLPMCLANELHPHWQVMTRLVGVIKAAWHGDPRQACTNQVSICIAPDVHCGTSRTCIHMPRMPIHIDCMICCGDPNLRQ